MSKDVTLSSSGLIDSVKETLSDPGRRIQLDDFVATELRRARERIRLEHFPLDAQPIDANSIEARLREYESIVARVSMLVALIGRWGTAEHRATLGRVIPRLADTVSDSGGNTSWLSLQWYPISLVQYVGGIAALSADNYENLATLLITPMVRDGKNDQSRLPVHTVVGALAEAETYEVFRKLPAHARHRAPRSEYMFNVVHPVLEEQLFLGDDYEGYFDRFEVLLALAYADRGDKDPDDAWGPPGRYAWKFGRGAGRDPFNTLVAEAAAAGDSWAPLRAGFFRGSSERFQKLAALFKERVLQQLRWY